MVEIHRHHQNLKTLIEILYGDASFEILLNVNFRTQAGEAAMDQEDKMVVPPRKEPEVEKKQKPEHEPESEFEKKRRVRRGSKNL